MLAANIKETQDPSSLSFHYWDLKCKMLGFALRPMPGIQASPDHKEVLWQYMANYILNTFFFLLPASCQQ